jgi:DNA-binding MarR family transcriptional regulator
MKRAPSTSKRVELDHDLDLAGQLRVVLGTLIRRLRREANLGDVTHPQAVVLGRLERDGPATVTQLARLEGVRSQSMGATIAALENAGLIQGSADPLDRRQTILTLTPRCRAWIKESRAAREDWLHAAIISQLSQSEQLELAKSVELLRRLAAA